MPTITVPDIFLPILDVAPYYNVPTPPSSDSRRKRRRRRRDVQLDSNNILNVYPGFQFDGFTNYSNLTKWLGVSLFLHNPPVIPPITTGCIAFYPNTSQTVEVLVRKSTFASPTVHVL